MKAKNIIIMALAGILLTACKDKGAGLIMFKQRKGLHTKKNDQGVFIYAYSKRI